jgi:hypothetical protein
VVGEGHNGHEVTHTHARTHTHFYSGKGKGTGEFGVAFVVDRIMKRNVLDIMAFDERICFLGIITKS